MQYLSLLVCIRAFIYLFPVLFLNPLSHLVYPRLRKGLYLTHLFSRVGQMMSSETGGMRTTRWSEGFPSLFESFSMGGFVTGCWKYSFSVVMMGSRIAGGSNLVGSVTTCFKEGDRFRIGDRFNLSVSPARIKCRPDPYLVISRL